MEIKSSAADFTVSGKHYFDDSYEYHVKHTSLHYLVKRLKRAAGARMSSAPLKRTALAEHRSSEGNRA